MSPALELRNRDPSRATGPLCADDWFTLPAQRRRLETAGFHREGLALRYLRLDGRWTDQELSAITVEDVQP